MCPPAKIITMRAEPMASGAMTPESPARTVHPMVSTRKNVPINSVIYLFIVTFVMGQVLRAVCSVAGHRPVFDCVFLRFCQSLQKLKKDGKRIRQAVHWTCR